MQAKQRKLTKSQSTAVADQLASFFFAFWQGRIGQDIRASQSVVIKPTSESEVDPPVTNVNIKH